VNTSSFFFGVALIFYRGDTQAKFLRYALNVPLANAEDVPRFEQVHFQFSKQLLLRSRLLMLATYPHSPKRHSLCFGNMHRPST